MDWFKLNADENRIMGKHFTPGRAGRKIDKVVVHYNYGDLSIKDVWDVWQTRPASAHYQVDRDGRIGQLVWDRDTAWHAGNGVANRTSIGVEHANGSRGDLTGPLTEACLDNGAHLVAALCKFYGLGRPEWKKNVFPHKAFSSTSCPGPLAASQRAAYVARMQYWYDQMTGAVPPKPPAVTPAPAEGRTLRRGSTGADVYELQRGLLRVFPSYAGPIKTNGGPNQTFGPATESVVKEFQRRVGITADGIVGPTTRSKLAGFGIDF